MRRVGFEPTIPVHGLDRAATVIGAHSCSFLNIMAGDLWDVKTVTESVLHVKCTDIYV
jgi:hypothetical protein